MKRYLLLSIFIAVVIWLVYAAVLLGLVPESLLPASFAKLTLPTSKSDFGQAFNAIEGLTSSLALVLGLVAIILQVRQTAEANEIGGLSARQQFLLADCDRLENQIQELKKCPEKDNGLFKNMVEKKKRQLDECKRIDERLAELLKRI
jgi:hypothetical protein